MLSYSDLFIKSSIEFCALSSCPYVLEDFFFFNLISGVERASILFFFSSMKIYLYLLNYEDIWNHQWQFIL